MDNDVRTVFDGPHQNRCRKGIVDNQRDIMPVGYFCNCLNIDDIGIGIAQGFNEDGFGILLNRIFKSVFLIRINECCADSGGQRKCMRQQVVRAAVDRL